MLRHISAAALALALAGQATAAATIVNPQGTVALGVNDAGHLISDVGGVAVNGGGTGTETGLAFRFADGLFYDATSPGCFCEGWGVSIGGATSGYAAVENGVAGLALIEFSATASTATSRVALSDAPGLVIEHAFAPAPNAPEALFRGRVTIANGTGADVTDLRYVRVMDWDVPPTEFNERVTIQGVATTSLLARSHNNGFALPDPLVDDGPIDPATLDADFVDFVSAAVPPNSDQGAYFMFDFGTLGAGQQIQFDIFYGAAASEAAALDAIAREQVELYSLGQSFDGYEDGAPATYIFAFAGVGGVPVPGPSAGALAALGSLGLGAVRHRMRRDSSSRTS